MTDGEVRPWDLRAAARANRRPVVLTVVSGVFLALQHVLLRSAAHDQVAHVLLAAGNGPPPAGAAALAVSVLVVRFVSYVIVPGLLLAALAELVAYALVGPKRPEEDELLTGYHLDDDDAPYTKPTGE